MKVSIKRRSFFESRRSAPKRSSAAEGRLGALRSKWIAALRDRRRAAGDDEEKAYDEVVRQLEAMVRAFAGYDASESLRVRDEILREFGGGR